MQEIAGSMSEKFQFYDLKLVSKWLSKYGTHWYMILSNLCFLSSLQYCTVCLNIFYRSSKNFLLVLFICTYPYRIFSKVPGAMEQFFLEILEETTALKICKKPINSLKSWNSKIMYVYSKSTVRYWYFIWCNCKIT